MLGLVASATTIVVAALPIQTSMSSSLPSAMTLVIAQTTNRTNDY